MLEFESIDRSMIELLEDGSWCPQVYTVGLTEQTCRDKFKEHNQMSLDILIENSLARFVGLYRLKIVED